MPGYNGRTAQANATAVNDQINRQRIAISVRNGEPLGDGTVGTVSAMGVSRDQSESMFAGFNGQEIMDDSFEVFLEPVDASQNPDFPLAYGPSTFRSNDQIISAAKVSMPSNAKDGPAIGKGPNLKAQNIDDVIAGTIVPVTSTVGSNLSGGRGFGITDPEDKGLTMGSYFKERYSVNDDAPSGTVTKGERDSVADDPYNYYQ